MINFTSGGFYLAFLFPLLGLRGRAPARRLAARARSRLGRWSTPISVVAAVWAVLQFLNIAWPRKAYPDTRFLDWSVSLAVIAWA